MAKSAPPSGRLKRSLGTVALMIYGVGDILGAGIYVLIGKVAGAVGPACWLSFVISFLVASLTGLCYAELGSRHPRSAGETVYSLHAFRNRALSYLIGFLVFLSGMVSLATVAHGFSGYLRAVFPQAPDALLMLFFLAVLTLINLWGIKQSSITNIVCTTIEISGLLIVMAAGMQFLGNVDYLSVVPAEGISPHFAFLQGAVLAFYAFIGFEDIVNVAEETRRPAQAIPRAIIAALIVAAIFYMLTAIAAVSAVPVAELSSSSAPLMLVVERGLPSVPRELFTLIALFAVTNTALINFIMSSRILYGMSREGLAPPVIARVHGDWGTPHVAILITLLIVVTLTFMEGLETLAQSTSLLLLSVFLVMNLSLIAIKYRSKGVRPAFQVPIWIPILGAAGCLTLIVFVEAKAFITVLILVLIGVMIYLFLRTQLR